MKPLQIKQIHPASLLVWKPEDYEECFIKVEGRKGPYIAKGNTTQQLSWMEPVTWNPSSRQEALGKQGFGGTRSHFACQINPSAVPCF